jgi:hypothetical protein
MVRQRSSEVWMMFMKRTIIAATVFFGSLLPARADNAIYADQGRGSEKSYTDSNACLNTRGAQTSGSVTARNATQCSRARGRIPGDNEFVCIVDVLHSEELTGAPIFYHLVRATLRITPPTGPAFETLVTNMIHWQVPPPRQGQRLRFRCDPASLSYFAFH